MKNLISKFLIIFKKRYFILVFAIFFIFTGQTCSLFGGGTASVYRSIDDGRSWQPITELAIAGERSENPPTSVYSMVVDPKNADNIYVGTLGSGIYRSQNKARTWKRINNGIQLFGTNPIIRSIVVDPKNDNNVYAAGLNKNYGKIFKSSDSGENWREVFSESGPELPMTSLSISFNNPNEIIAGGRSGGVFLSLDGGDSWQHIGFFDDILEVGIGAKDSTLFAFSSLSGGYRSDDFGKSWHQITRRVGVGKDFSINSVNIGAVGFAPKDRDTIYVSTDSGIFQTKNAGISWRLLPTPLPREDAPLATDIVVSYQNSNIFYFTVPNVVYKDDNSNGVKWISTQLSLDAQVGKLAVDPKSASVIYAGIGR